MVQELSVAFTIPTPLRGRKKIVIGLTGDFGSGKSTVAHLFGGLGAFVMDADAVVHEALREPSPVYPKIAALFKTARTAGGKLDRKKIAKIVFKDDALRKKLESILHPYVFEKMISEAGEAGERVIVLEVPLLFETGFDHYCHKTVVVDAPIERMNKRLLEKGFTMQDIRARRALQLPREEKIKKADIVIRNSGTIQETKREVEKAWKKILPASKGAVTRRWQKKK